MGWSCGGESVAMENHLQCWWVNATSPLSTHLICSTNHIHSIPHFSPTVLRSVSISSAFLSFYTTLISSLHSSLYCATTRKWSIPHVNGRHFENGQFFLPHQFGQRFENFSFLPNSSGFCQNFTSFWKKNENFWSKNRLFYPFLYLQKESTNV